MARRSGGVRARRRVLIRLNDLEFNVEVEGSGPPLLLLHGFTGSLRSWDELRADLVGVRTLVAIDLIGHGASAAPPDAARYSLDWATRDIRALLDSLGFDHTDVLGYSMGGRVALHFAVSHPARVTRLLLESASPGIENQSERQRRIESDLALAERILERGVQEFVEEWERQPLLALGPLVTEAARQRQHDLRLANSPIGLASSLRGMGAGQQAPLWSQLSRLTMPVHLIVGESDFRYREIAQRMAEALPSVQVSVFARAGHTVHIDQPAEFSHVVRAALAPADCTLS